MEKLWYTQDGRVLRVSEMTLDHLVNSWHMMAFMTATMRKQGALALGGLHNRNVNEATMNAFKVVTPSDVFTLYDDIKTQAQLLFVAKFGYGVADLRKQVWEAWNADSAGHVIDPKYRAGVWFMLKAGPSSDGRAIQKSRIDLYLRMASIDTDEGFQRICWNLRIDQAQLWKLITENGQTGLLKSVPSKRLRSALRFRRAYELPSDDDMPFDHAFDAMAYGINQQSSRIHRVGQKPIIEYFMDMNKVFEDLPFYLK